MEEFFLKKRSIFFEAWQAGLSLIAAILGVIGFGALVEHGVSDPSRSGPLATAAVEIARIPANGRSIARQLIQGRSPTMADENRFDGEAGFERFKPAGDPGAALLLSRFDGAAQRSVVELLDLKDGSVLRRYAPDLKAIIDRSKAKASFVDLKRDRGPRRFLMTHPLPTGDGGLVFHGMYTPLVKIDACSNIVWEIDGFFHHSIEEDADGNYWVGSVNTPPQTDYTPADGYDETITKVSPDGQILLKKSVGRILMENGLEYLIFSGETFRDDPTHLNDIQPVLADGPYWRRGDLFLSLRNPSTVLLYRPSTNKVIWLKQGPWMMQHDVDMLNDHEIAVFNNHAARVSYAEIVFGSNNTLVYDFATGQTRAPYAEGYKRNEIRTVTEGGSEVLSDGDVFVEEQNYGRLLQMNAAGDLAWRYVNRAPDGGLYLVRWSRYLKAPQAEALEKAYSEATCKGAI